MEDQHKLIDFETRAKKYRNKLLLYFAISLLFAWGSLEISFHWIGQLVSLASSTALLFLIFMLYSWFKDYKNAKSDSKTRSAEHMQSIWRSVIGPFPWN